MDSLDIQRKRLEEVLNYLKSIGYKQYDICFNTGIHETNLPHYKSGKIKKIPEDFLIGLQNNYDINPDYIRNKSDEMLDSKGEKYKYFEKLVDEWGVVKEEDNNYLYLRLDENFYNFLIELDEYRKAEEDGIIVVEEKINELKEIHSSKINLADYVLIPRNNFVEIIQADMGEINTFMN
ncbi:hypothetical protein LJB88_04750 [Erysipelotrichaceae bacterium OttesenSCG-928-M19]|nr:hypothetical protein [Erysipelotrichaceae bacterium OttesenSCG-928-M19]